MLEYHPRHISNDAASTRSKNSIKTAANKLPQSSNSSSSSSLIISANTSKPPSRANSVSGKPTSRNNSAIKRNTSLLKNDPLNNSSVINDEIQGNSSLIEKNSISQTNSSTLLNHNSTDINTDSVTLDSELLVQENEPTKPTSRSGSGQPRSRINSGLSIKSNVHVKSRTSSVKSNSEITCGNVHVKSRTNSVTSNNGISESKNVNVKSRTSSVNSNKGVSESKNVNVKSRTSSVNSNKGVSESKNVGLKSRTTSVESKNMDPILTNISMDSKKEDLNQDNSYQGVNTSSMPGSPNPISRNNSASSKNAFSTNQPSMSRINSRVSEINSGVSEVQGNDSSPLMNTKLVSNNNSFSSLPTKVLSNNNSSISLLIQPNQPTLNDENDNRNSNHPSVNFTKLDSSRSIVSDDMISNTPTLLKNTTVSDNEERIQYDVYDPSNYESKSYKQNDREIKSILKKTSLEKSEPLKYGLNQDEPSMIVSKNPPKPITSHVSNDVQKPVVVSHDYSDYNDFTTKRIVTSRLSNDTSKVLSVIQNDSNDSSKRPVTSVPSNASHHAPLLTTRSEHIAIPVKLVLRSKSAKPRPASQGSHISIAYPLRRSDIGDIADGWNISTRVERLDNPPISIFRDEQRETNRINTAAKRTGPSRIPILSRPKRVTPKRIVQPIIVTRPLSKTKFREKFSTRNRPSSKNGSWAHEQLPWIPQHFPQSPDPSLVYTPHHNPSHLDQSSQMNMQAIQQHRPSMSYLQPQSQPQMMMGHPNQLGQSFNQYPNSNQRASFVQQPPYINLNHRASIVQQPPYPNLNHRASVIQQPGFPNLGHRASMIQQPPYPNPVHRASFIQHEPLSNDFPPMRRQSLANHDYQNEPLPSESGIQKPIRKDYPPPVSRPQPTYHFPTESRIPRVPNSKTLGYKPSMRLPKTLPPLNRPGYYPTQKQDYYTSTPMIPPNFTSPEYESYPSSAPPAEYHDYEQERINYNR